MIGMHFEIQKVVGMIPAQHTAWFYFYYFTAPQGAGVARWESSE